MKIDSLPKLIIAMVALLVGFNIPEIFEFLKRLFGG